MFIAGWVGVALFAAAALVINGDFENEWNFAAVIVGIAVGMIAWYRMSSGRAAVIAGLVLGALVTVQQVAFVASDLGSSDTSFVKTTLVDMFGLGAALLVLAGSILGLVRRHRAR